MKGTLATSEDRLWLYLIVPVVVLLLGSTLAYGTYYALAAVRPQIATLIPAGQVTFALYVLIAIVEWSLAISVIRRLRRAHSSALDLIAPEGHPWHFRWLPTTLMFVGVNAIMGLMMIMLAALQSASPSFAYYEGLQKWQLLLFVGVIPISAGFCEELIWRGYLITGLEAGCRAMVDDTPFLRLIRPTPLARALALHLPFWDSDRILLRTRAEPCTADDRSRHSGLLELWLVPVLAIDRCRDCDYSPSSLGSPTSGRPRGVKSVQQLRQDAYVLLCARAEWISIKPTPPKTNT